MQINEHTALVDNDFISHLASCHLSDEQLVKDLNIIFSALSIFATIHPLVYDNELLKDQPRINLLFDRSVFSKATFSDILQNDSARKIYYIQMVRNLYYTLNGEELPFNGDDVLTCWKRKQSLGEIHSITTCQLCGCSVFLSDDNDAKILKKNIDRMFINNVNVYSRQEFMDKYMASGNNTLTRTDRRALTHSSST